MSGKKITGLVILIVGVLTFLFPIISSDTFYYSRSDSIQIFLYVVGIVLVIVGIIILLSDLKFGVNTNVQNTSNNPPKISKKRIIISIILFIILIVIQNIIFKIINK
jgi:hypothetical protein